MDFLVEDSELTSGLNFEIFEGSWNRLPDFNQLTPVSSGVADAITLDLPELTQDDEFGARFTGFIEVPRDDTYTFYTTSDDGSQLSIGEIVVVDNDGLHAARERSGEIELSAGKHPLTVTSFEKFGEETLSVSLEGGGLSKQVLPATRLFREETTTDEPPALENPNDAPEETTDEPPTFENTDNPSDDLLSRKSPSETMTFPEDAGVIDVTTYGALPNDGQDDTAAIQKAIDENDGDLRRTIYFPNGQYDISAPVADNASAAIFVQDNSRTAYIGESRDGVIWKLADHHPDFQDPENPKAIFAMATSPGFGFHSPLRNMSFNVGQGNEGAIGLRYFSNNGGTLGNIKLIAEAAQGQRAGVVGLDLAADNNGPFFVKDLEIIGFDTGIRDESGLWGFTLRNIRLEDQNRLGYQKGSQTVTISNLNSFNDVTAIAMGASSGSLTLIDSSLQTLSEATSNPAIQYNYGSLFLRHLETQGYTDTLTHQDGQVLIEDPQVEEYSAIVNSNTPLQEDIKIAPWSTETSSLNLPLREMPRVPWETDFSRWAGPHQFGGLAGDDQDDSAALQAAIDSGANTIYFPGPEPWALNEDVYLRGNVERVIALSRLDGEGNWILVDENTTGSSVDPSTLPETVLLENIWAFRDIKHQSDRTLALQGIYGVSLEAGAMGSGPIIAEDYLGNLQLSAGREIWVSQLNTESGESPITDLGPEDVGIVNDGGQLQILGMKTEKGSIKIDTRHGGRTEVLGAHIAEVGNNPATNEPIFRSQEGKVSYVNLRTSSFADDNYQTLVEEIREGESRRTLREEGFSGDGWATGDGVAFPLYVGW